MELNTVLLKNMYKSNFLEVPNYRVCSMHIRGATMNFSLAIPKVRRSFKGEGFASKIPNLESIDKTAVLPVLPMTVPLLIAYLPEQVFPSNHFYLVST